MPELFPTGLKQVDARHLGIVWNDDHESVYDVKVLREACHCAACKDEFTGENRIPPGSIPDDIHPADISPVGRYGLTIRWSDGHDTGIYPFERLRELCPCPECRVPVQKKPG
jgi:DUF971 family protein